MTSTYVPTTQQLVTEVFVRDAPRAKDFYQQLGFQVAEDRGTFVVLTWEGHELFLDQRTGLAAPSAVPQANVRIMVANVDAYWLRAQHIGARVLAPIEDRDYGLRDFTILDPDGFGLVLFVLKEDSSALPSGEAVSSGRCSARPTCQAALMTRLLSSQWEARPYPWRPEGGGV